MKKDDSANIEDQDDLTDVRDKYAAKLQERINKGETLTPAELDFLTSTTEAQGDEFPERLKVATIKYPRSPAQIEQARKNIVRINKEKLQTGAKTPEGKARSARNAVKHGLYAQSLMSLFKPCFTTCPDYPCSLVQEGQTQPGDNCLEKQHFVEILDAVEKAMRHKKYDDLNDLMALEISSNWDMLRRLKEQILHIGPLVKSIKKVDIRSKDGDSTTTEYIEYKPNPAMQVISKLISDMGLTLGDAMLTPRELARNKIDTKAVESLSDKAARLKSRFMKKKTGEDQ